MEVIGLFLILAAFVGAMWLIDRGIMSVTDTSKATSVTYISRDSTDWRGPE